MLGDTHAENRERVMLCVLCLCVCVCVLHCSQPPSWQRIRMKTQHVWAAKVLKSSNSAEPVSACSTTGPHDTVAAAAGQAWDGGRGHVVRGERPSGRTQTHIHIMYTLTHMHARTIQTIFRNTNQNLLLSNTRKHTSTDLPT